MAPSARPYPLSSSEAAHPVRRISVRGVEERRLEEFTSGQYSRWNINSALFEHKTDDKKVISLSVWEPKAHTKPTFDEAVKQEYKPLQKGYLFGPSW